MKRQEEIRIAVTGATSFLGAALIRELTARGYRVHAIVRPGSANRRVLEGLPVHVAELDLSRLDQVRDVIGESCDVFFHFGWDGSGSDNRKKTEIQRQNAEDGLRALEGARSLGCSRFVFSGSQAEYGVCRTLMSEDRPCRPASEYGKAKVRMGDEARRLCRRWRETGEYDMEYIHVRIFSVYGPGDHPWSLVNSCLDTFLKGGTMNLSDCTQQWNFLYIDDLVKGLMALAFCGERVEGTYNLAAGPEDTRPLSEYVEQMYCLCGKRGDYVYGKLPPNAEGRANLIPDIRRIQEKTGWKPETSFEEGIRRMMESRERENKRSRCILCGRELRGSRLMELEDMPSSAQDIPDEAGLAEDGGISLCLHQCPDCGLVQFDCEPVAYYRDVIRSGGYSTTMVELRTRQYRHLIETYGLEGKKFLEVGCGRGEFLKVLTGFPVKAWGVEHRPSLVQEARAEGLCVTEGFAETEDAVLGSHGPYDVFLSFNFLEHQPEPGVMLDCIRKNLTEEGMGLITVPSLEYILKYDGYYELLRDHIAYYTFDTLRELLRRHGFQVLEEETVNRDTLSVIVRKTDGEFGPGERTAARVDVSGLRASLAGIRGQMEELCGRLEREGQSLAIWGASHQGFTLAATTVLKDHARYIIDSAPFKQGKFAPASHLPILSPKDYHRDPVDVILIAAPGYTEEIASSIRERFGGRVRILAMRSNRLEELS